MTNMKTWTKQQVLDKTPETNQEIALQNMLFSFSKTKLEQMKRVLNEINTVALYKTQLRALPWTDIHEAIITACQLNTKIEPIQNENTD